MRAGFTADFATIDITAGRTVTLDSSRTIGTVKFGDLNNGQDWTLGVANNAVLTFSGTPTINISNGTTTINPVLAGTEGFTRTGPGTLNLSSSANTLTGKISLNGGLTRFRATGTFGIDPGVPSRLDYPERGYPDEQRLHPGCLAELGHHARDCQRQPPGRIFKAVDHRKPHRGCG